ncbi:MAG: hypothetical protein C5B47_00235 [Verrucomicrobia bacterium]|nr:MAG: hypothetical protein C5B47_00235 [Verrucomicrobiota bacterium]
MSTSVAKAKPDATLATLADLRRVASLTGFTKKIFLQGNAALSPAAVTMQFRQLMKLVGVELPSEVNVSLDVAQIVIAGGAISRDIKTGADTLQCVGDIGVGLSSVASLLADLGVVDQEVGDFGALLGSGSLAISSGGLNILADISAVISLINVIGDLGTDFFGSKDQAISKAKAALSKAAHAEIDPQIKYAAEKAKEFQLGKLNYFDFVADIALESPLLFKNFFPGLAAYLPSHVVTLTGKGKSSGLFSSEEDTETLQLTEAFATKRQVETFLVNHFFLEPLSNYSQYFNIEPKISIKALSILSMLLASGSKGSRSIGFDFDIISSLVGLGITPNVLGDSWLFKGFMREETELSDWKATLPYQTLTIPYVGKPELPSLVINGKYQFTSAKLRQAQDAAKIAELQLKMQELDESGNIEELIKIPEAVAIMRRWADIRIDPVYDDFHEIKNFKLIGRSIKTQSWFQDPLAAVKNPMFWPFVKKNYMIDISDYWKILGTLKQMQNSNLLKDDVAPLSRFGDIDSLQSEFRNVYQFVLMKALNRVARERLSKDLKIPFDKLGSRKTSNGKIVFYQKTA